MESNRNIFSYLWVLFAFWGVCQLAGAQSAGQNYIRTRSYTSASTYLDRIQYYDGLGRLTQTVDKGITPGGHDLVTNQEYDNFGRPSLSWLPGMVSNNNGALVTGDLAAAVKATNRGDQKPFSMPIYEPSPLNRITHQFSPGEEWYDNGRAVKTEYLANTASGNQSCGRYSISGDNLVRNGVYPANVLFVTKMTDEDNIVSYEFRDKLDRVILQRRISGNISHDTYFVYDDFGNLCYVLPPLAADGTTGGTYTVASQAVADYAYVYRYDHRNRCISKKLPGAGWCEMVYDRADRLVLSQDGKQQGNTWKFYRYDTHGRLVISGVKSDAVSAGTYRTSFKESLFVESRIDGGIFLYTSSCPYSATPGEIMSVNYYDDASWLDLLSSTDRNMLTYTAKTGYGIAHSSAKGLLTGNWGKLLDGSVEYCEAYYYDEKGRVVQQISKNHTGGYDKHYFAYNYDGTVEKKLTEHTSPNATAITELYTYTYDHAGRLKKTTYKLNNETPVVMAEYTYNDLVQVSNKKLSNNAYSSSFTYNVRGWLESQSGNLFSQQLYYTKNANNATGYFNGNISSMDWNTNNSGLRRYNFTYDQLGRMTRASYALGQNINGNIENFTEAFEYNKMGNPVSFERWGRRDNMVYGIVDDLIFTYSGNKPLRIIDDFSNQLSSDMMEFKHNVSVSSNQYEYDGNGNTIKDLNKNISYIDYNYLYLPKQVQFQDGKQIETVYDASGVKCKVKHVGTSTSTRDYIGNKVYDDNVLKMVLTDEGYVAKEGSLFKHYYYLKDHLGNNRVVMDASGQVVQTTDYYASGLSTTRGTNPEKQPYKYNGKELDRMYGFDTYDYGARMYDPALGRFMTMDPKAEKNYSVSPYSYCNNNPVNAIDPDGRDYYFMTQDGRTILALKTEDKTDQLFAFNYNTNKVDAITVNDRKLLSE